MGRLDDQFFARHLDDDEEVVLIVHKHWLIGLKHLVWPSVSFVFGAFVLYFAPFQTVLYGFFVWSVVSFVWWMRNFFDYYLDAWIITDQGIIDVAWHGWFHRQSSRVLYSDIQGVSYEIQGVLGTLLRYGEITVEKISTGNSISLDDVSSPRSIESTILKCMEEYLHTKNLSDAKHVQKILSEIVSREIHLEEFADDEEDEEEDGDDMDDDQAEEDDDSLQDDDVQYIEYEEYREDRVG